MEQQGSLFWRFDVSTFHLIGRDLISDRITALFELIKNCYDANATDVKVTFEHLQPGDSVASSITVEDNGLGMSFEDIRDKWMVIGTSSKRRNPVTPAPFYRQCVGEKGIGRFAVDKLGNTLRITTKKAGEDSRIIVDVNWDAYQTPTQNENGSIRLFTEIGNHYHYEASADLHSSGTKLYIQHLRDTWVKEDVIRLLKEASKIVSPFEEDENHFRIRVVAPDFEIDNLASNYRIKVEDLATMSGCIQARDGMQEFLMFDEQSGKMKVDNVEIKSFGPVSMRFYYFNSNARKKFRERYKTLNLDIDGVKIYRDGIIATPFAEREESSDKKRDILGIDKRLWVDLFNKVSTREIIGIVDITKENNPGIIDATNRQDFTDTPEYRDLKAFILCQIHEFDRYKVFQRKQKQNQSPQVQTIESISAPFGDLNNILEYLEQASPNTIPQVNEIKGIIQRIEKSIQKAVQGQKDLEEEYERHESLYLRSMSRKEDAILVTHAVKTSTGKIIRQANFFAECYPNSFFDNYFMLYARQISQEMHLLERVIDEIFDYSKVNQPFVNVDIKFLLNSLLSSYTSRFKEEGIQLETLIDDKVILECNQLLIDDIVQNITDNAIKAMSGVDKKIYRCTVKVEEEKLIMNFSDTGCGIPKDKRTWVFGIYNTTTEEQGGGGVGLYIVKNHVEMLRGRVSVIDSEFAPVGTTIHIELPFKKE
jgi:signal transduction histidine kinase